LRLPQGGHKGRPYNAIFSHLLSDVCGVLITQGGTRISPRRDSAMSEQA